MVVKEARKATVRLVDGELVVFFLDADFLLHPQEGRKADFSWWVGGNSKRR